MTPEVPRQKDLPITAKTLLEVNQEDEAQINLRLWQEAKERKQGELTLVILCSDARLNSIWIMGGNILVASVSNIAANGETEPFKYLIRHKGVGRVVVVGHYDGKKLEENGVIAGCGGVDARQQITNEDQPPADELTAFISRIQPDSLKQTVAIVKQVSRLAGDKPVYGIAVDHLTLMAAPIAQSIVNERKERAIIYPQIIDNEGELGQIPALEEGSLTTEFLEIIEKNTQLTTARLMADPGFAERQKVQNPRAVVLSTSPIPIGLRYPPLFGCPNTAFVVRLPIEKLTEIASSPRVKIRAKDLKQAITQLYYPIKHAIYANEGQSFFDTKTLIIETSSLEESKRIAQQLIADPLIQEWIKQRGGKIIVTEVKSGKTEKAEDFDVSGRF
ncbi:MAG: hypothetical protein QHH09_00450 [Microgenomates group bacterium]|nr:hypothetical protein [Microgenomates group bacterium]